jgi:hypothetical protein
MSGLRHELQALRTADHMSLFTAVEHGTADPGHRIRHSSVQML